METLLGSAFHTEAAVLLLILGLPVTYRFERVVEPRSKKGAAHGRCSRGFGSDPEVT